MKRIITAKCLKHLSYQKTFTFTLVVRIYIDVYWYLPNYNNLLILIVSATCRTMRSPSSKYTAQKQEGAKGMYV